MWSQGASEVDTNVQTTLVPAGGATIVDFRAEVPGNLVLVDHSIFRTFHKGSLGILHVRNSTENQTIYSGRQSESPYNGEHLTGTNSTPNADAGAVSPQPGERTFLTICAGCHQRNGMGIPNVFHPLRAPTTSPRIPRAIRTVLAGVSGPIEVNGQTFNGAMPPLANLTDQEIADVLTWVDSDAGNHLPAVTPAQVAAVRAAPAGPAPAH